MTVSERVALLEAAQRATNQESLWLPMMNSVTTKQPPIPLRFPQGSGAY